MFTDAAHRCCCCLLLPQYAQEFERLLAEDRSQFLELPMLAVNSDNRPPVVMLQVLGKHKLNIFDTGALPRRQGCRVAKVGFTTRFTQLYGILRNTLWLVLEGI
jgi:hypothetical protein